MGHDELVLYFICKYKRRTGEAGRIRRLVGHWDQNWPDFGGRGEILGLEGYSLLRRENIIHCFSLNRLKYCIGFDLPDKVSSDPTLMIFAVLLCSSPWIS